MLLVYCFVIKIDYQEGDNILLYFLFKVIKMNNYVNKLLDLGLKFIFFSDKKSVAGPIGPKEKIFERLSHK